MGVGGQMEDVRRLHRARDRVHRAAIHEVPFVDRDRAAEVDESPREDRGNLARQRVDLGAFRDKPVREVRTDEPVGAGYEDARVTDRVHGTLLSVASALSSSASLYVSIDFQNPR